jgi:hypothetical protein
VLALVSLIDPSTLGESMDIILIIAILLLIFGGAGAVMGFLGNLAWILIILAVIAIAWRLITGRRAI